MQELRATPQAWLSAAFPCSPPPRTTGQYIPPTGVHARGPNAFQVGWTGDTIHLKVAGGDDVDEISATQPAIDQLNATPGRALGVSIHAFPVGARPTPPGFVDWLLAPDTYVPVKPEETKWLNA